MSIFTQKSPRIMADLMRDFPISKEDAAAILGNLGHECAGFTKLQETNPAISGSRGGYGWAQWTGPRRRAFEVWCKPKGLKPSSDEANYGFLVYELHTTERAAIPAVKAARNLTVKVAAFEEAFERAGVKHYDSRTKYAKDALKAYIAAFPVAPPSPDIPGPVPPVAAPPDAPGWDVTPNPPSGPTPTQVAAGGLVAAIAVAVAAFWGKVSAFVANLF